MIRINLLGVAAPHVKERPERRTPPVAFQAGTFVGAVVVFFAIVGLIYKFWNGAVTNLQTELKKEQAEEARLAGIKAENVRYQQQLALLQQRINTIQTLQTSRTGPVELMISLSNVVNRTGDIYLYSMTPAGDRLGFRGQSGSVESMAEFISALNHSGAFEDVQLRQFFEDDQHGRLTYKFVLDCQYKQPGAAAGAASNAGTAGASSPAHRAGK